MVVWRAFKIPSLAVWYHSVYLMILISYPFQGIFNLPFAVIKDLCERGTRLRNMIQMCSYILENDWWSSLGFYFAINNFQVKGLLSQYEPPHDETNKMTVRPAKTRISLVIRPVWSVFAVGSMGSLGPKLSSCGQRRLWLDWADAQADLSLRWVHSQFVGFVKRRLI